MKRNILVAVLLAGLLLTGCHEGKSLKIGASNKTFKKMPAICLAEANEMGRIGREMDKTDKPEELIRYSSEQIEVEAAVRNRQDQEFEKLRGGKVPFEVSPNVDYRVLSGTITGWNYPTRSLKITFRVVPGEFAAKDSVAQPADSICYLACLNKKGEPLGSGAIRLIPAEDGATDNGKTVMEGVYDCSFWRIRKFNYIDFDKVVFLPAAEYEAVSKRVAAAERGV